MIFKKTSLSGVFIIEPTLLADNRGGFSRLFCRKAFFHETGFAPSFVQINQSFNKKEGTFRGLHYQNPPHSEAKLVRCVSGSVSDYIVDVRPESATFLQHICVELSFENMKMVFIPEGFAHGFITLEDNTSLIYHHTEYHKPEAERILFYNDPRLNLKLARNISVISQRDSNPSLLPIGELK